MIWRLMFSLLVVSYICLVFPFSDYLAKQPVTVKLGYPTPAEIVRVVSGEHGTTNAALMVSKVIFYYGTLLQELSEKNRIPPEYFNMYKTLEGAVEIDPYNLDAYYFSQAVFTWEVGRIKEVNKLLEKGMKHRVWDPWLPFFIGFNHYYFLNEPAKAAPYMEKAAMRSSNPLFTALTSRYFYESDQSEMGLAFLEEMIKQTNNSALRRSYEIRRDALKALALLQRGVLVFEERFGHLPSRLDDLVSSGVLLAIPSDPYGGIFFLNKNGRVRSTSNLVFPSTSGEMN